MFRIAYRRSLMVARVIIMALAITPVILCILVAFVFILCIKAIIEAVD
jgi:hypothetical protein